MSAASLTKKSVPTVAKRDFPFKRDNQYYINFDKNGVKEQLVLPAVTTILNATSSKPMLIRWAAKQAAQVALVNPQMSVEEVVANSIDLRKTTALDTGKAIHSFAEDYNNGIVLDPAKLAPELQGYAEAFLKFIELFQPRVLFTEVCVFNVTHKYAGTADLIAILANGKTAILDWKTGKSTYKESHLQQMAYANAEWIYTKDHQVLEMPHIDEQYLVHLQEKGTAQLIPVEEPFEHFLKALAYYPVAKWLQEW